MSRNIETLFNKRRDKRRAPLIIAEVVVPLVIVLAVGFTIRGCGGSEGPTGWSQTAARRRNPKPTRPCLVEA